MMGVPVYQPLVTDMLDPAFCKAVNLRQSNLMTATTIGTTNDSIKVQYPVHGFFPNSKIFQADVQ
jgi:hypothetical protein